MKHIKLYLFIVWAIIFSLVKYANADIKKVITLEGIEITKSEFQKYACEKSDLTDYYNCTKPLLELQTIQINQDEIKMKMELKCDNISIKFNCNGLIYQGINLQLNQSPNLIIDAETDNNDIDVRLIELVYGHDSKVLYSNNSNYIFKIYLMHGEKLLLFEKEMPDIFRSLDKFDYKQISDSTKSFLWMYDIISPKTEMLKDPEGELFQKSIKSNMATNNWSFGTAYSATYTVFSETYVYASMPCGRYTIQNTSTSDTTWKMEFYINERVTMNGIEISGVDNVINYRNVKLNVVTGKDTQVLRSFISGRVYNNLSLGNVTDAAVSVLSSVNKWWNYGYSIFQALSYLSNSGSTNLGNSYFTLYPAQCTAAREVIGSNYRLYKNGYSSGSYTTNGHYLIADFVVNSYTTGITTTAGFRYGWDAYLYGSGSSLATDVNYSITASYHS